MWKGSHWFIVAMKLSETGLFHARNTSDSVALTRPEQIDRYSLQKVFDAANGGDTLIVGTGNDVWVPPKGLREELRAVRIVLDAMQTGPAIRTYNIMLGERRRVAAALIAVA